MQVNTVNQTADYNLPFTGNTEKADKPRADEKLTKPINEAQDQIEVKEISVKDNAPVESHTSLRFSHDVQTKELVVELVNTQTGEALRQTPSEVSLKLSAVYAQIQGKLVNKNY